MMAEIWSLSALCRCCHADGTFKSLDFAYSYKGKIEEYAVMLRDTFGLFVNPPPIEASYSICDNCIKQLRTALEFKNQVELCEIKFENYCKNELAQQTEIKLENINDGMMIKPEFNYNVEVCLNEYKDNKFFIDGNDNLKTSDGEHDYSFEREDKPDIETLDQKHNLEKQKPYKPGDRRSKPKLKKVKYKKVKTEKGFLYTCQDCERSFETLKDLKLHVKKEHFKTTFCKICNKLFKRKSGLERHERKHHKRRYDCNMCHMSFPRLRGLINHRYKHVIEKGCECDYCNKKFSTKSVLTKHIAMHNGRNKKFMCDLCGSSFNDRTNMNKHFLTVHEKLKLFKCDLCPKTYAAKKTLKVHYRVHSGERPYKCELCLKTFMCATRLRDHNKIHSNIAELGGKYGCKFCGAVYNNRGPYVSHIKTHNQCKPYKCFMCEKSFMSHYSLKRHIDLHNGIRRFSCDICHKQFGARSQVLRHVKNLHDPNKIIHPKIKCDLCPMSVTDMKKHMKTHTSRELQCGYCPKTYSERNALNRHIKQRHSGISHKCDICGRIFVKLGSLKSHKLKQHPDQIKDEEVVISQFKCEKICTE